MPAAQSSHGPGPESQPTALLGDAFDDAWQRSWYRGLSAHARERLLATAVRLKLGSGDLLPDVGPTSQAGLVLTGMLRVHIRYGQRQATLQYAQDGDAFGIPDLSGGDSAAAFEAAAEALVETQVILFARDEFADLLESDPTVATAVIHGLRSALYASVSLLAENVLFPLRQRVARHLLDLATRDGASIVVAATTQDLANATGSVREVVARLLSELKRSGVIARSGNRLEIHDLRRLHEIAKGTDPDF